MRINVIIEKAGFQKLVGDLKFWANQIMDDLQDAGNIIATKYKAQIKYGQNGDGSLALPVKESTMGMPIRFSTDETLRKVVNSSRNPLVARGRAVESIKMTRLSDSIEIEPSTPHGKLIFASNAYATKKKKRDPLVVSDIQEQIIENAITKSLLKVLHGV